MAKIIYGVAGEGLGHAARSKVIIDHLLQKGHEVKILTHDRAYDYLKNKYRPKKIFGLSFFYRDNKVNYLNTIVKNIVKFPQARKSLNECLGLCGRFKPDLVISDFEPISGLVANIKNIPLVSIDNMHILTKAKVDYPVKYEKDALAAKAVVRVMIFNAKAYLITSFFPGKPKSRKVFVFPPIIRDEIKKLKAPQKEHVLVYLTSNHRGIIDFLKNIQAQFIIYGLNLSKKQGNLVFKKICKTGFLKDLAASRGIIATAGFTLISEALYLGKPYLAIPVIMQFEQTLNAYQLDKLGYGKFYTELNQEKIEAFLYNLADYRENLKKYAKEGNGKILAKVDELVARFEKL